MSYKFATPIKYAESDGISYNPKENHAVYLDKKKIGKVVKRESGYAYKPNGNHGYGETYPSIRAVLQTL